MVEEALNLAYHGARAEKPGFNVTIDKSLDPNAGAADLYAQEMTRVLLNLISNGFYATTKRKLAEATAAYEPTITASTRDLGESVEIAIRDNGTGIPDEVKAKMFNPFFTTKPAGEGTGLGLSLSHDIIVKQHGGTIEVATEPGVFTAIHHHSAARSARREAGSSHERADSRRRRRARRRGPVPPAVPPRAARRRASPWNSRNRRRRRSSGSTRRERREPHPDPLRHQHAGHERPRNAAARAQGAARTCPSS